jgi:hypothetical protein
VKLYSPESMREAAEMTSRELTASHENGATTGTGRRGASARRAEWTSTSRDATIAATAKTPAFVRVIHPVVRIRAPGRWRQRLA